MREEQGVYKGLVVVHAFVKKKKKMEYKDQKKKKNYRVWIGVGT